MSIVSIARHHAEWLSLVEVSGPFLSMPVLLRAFPQGLDEHDAEGGRQARSAYEEWADNQGGTRPDPAIHRAWIRFVLTEVLGFAPDVLAEGPALPEALATTVAEQHETLRPDLAVLRADRGEAARLLVAIAPRSQGLEKPQADRRWKASPASRMAELLRGAGVPLGLVTNGEQWMLVHAPRGETAGFASWYAETWFDERITLRAFRSLLSMGRFFGVADADTPEALLRESMANQQEVTDQLGYQVRQAVEVLVGTLDRIDRDQSRALLRDTPETTLYEAALTVMMRLVFLFSAEERGLLLLGDPLYDQHYAVSTLGAQLRGAADQAGEEVLERRNDAWSRLLATFRAVHGGVAHEDLRLPAYGGDLFDPDRFPFLEGRLSGTSWRDTGAGARALPIDNRTVLHLLDALQVLRVKVAGGPAEPRRVSFRALDIEQIGHVYEGLLDHTAKRATEPVLGLSGGKDREPEVSLVRLEELRAKGDDALLAFLGEETGKTPKALAKALAPQADLLREGALRAACDNDDTLLARVAPFAGLIRDDSFGRPVVIPAGGVYVTSGTDRRSSGTHYTPRSLTEPIVRHTLDPLVYVGPAEGKPKSEWQLRPAADILRLTVCDMAMGSGAFLVQACRYLSERLVESWQEAEEQAMGRVVVTPEGNLSTGATDERPLPRDPEERLAVARRVVADRCLYGVDKNPLAVEMGKLSLWLVTLHKGRPFTFLDHALRSGDSLLGICNVDQITYWSMKPDPIAKNATYITGSLQSAVAQAIALRNRIRATDVDDARDAQQKQHWQEQAEVIVDLMKLAGDLLVGAGLLPDVRQRSYLLDDFLVRLTELSRSYGQVDIAQLTRDDSSPLHKEYNLLRLQANELLGKNTPFHWPLEFPEVFSEQNSDHTILIHPSEHPRLSSSLGFAAVVGNPPFQGGTIATTELGEHYMSFLQRFSQPWHGKADLVVGFFKRVPSLLRYTGYFSLVATSSLLRGESLESGIRDLLAQGFVIYSARSPYKWPGGAKIEAVNVSMARRWVGQFLLDNQSVEGITEDLSAGEPDTRAPVELQQSVDAFLGIKLCPNNRETPLVEYRHLSTLSPGLDTILQPVLGGDELYSLVDFAEAPRVVVPEGLRIWLKQGHRAPGSIVPDPDYYTHSRPAAALQSAMLETGLAFACGETSTVLRFARVPTSNVILKHKLIIFPTNTWATFSILQSVVHCSWAWRWGLRRTVALVYSPKRCAKTFPYPEALFLQGSHSPIEIAGEQFHNYRQDVMVMRQEGLTKTYSRFHNASEKSSTFAHLRDLQVGIDQQVIEAYGWSDLQLDHDFHQTQQGLRFTVTETARREILNRLLDLNHQRYAQEAMQDIGGKKFNSERNSAMRRGNVTPQQSAFVGMPGTKLR